jgi:glycosyltransferase involved in cell wall biosynthesis
MNNRIPINIGIVTFPLIKSGLVPLSNLIQVLYPFSKKIHVITGNEAYILANDKKPNVYFHFVSHSTGINNLTRITNFIYTQLKLSYKLAITRKRVGLWFFFLGEGGLLLPMLTAKMLRTKVILVSAASESGTSEAQSDPYARPLFLLEKANRRLADRIIVYSPSIINEWNLGKYRSKILIAHEHFLNFDKFKMRQQLNDRDNLIGYVGRFSGEKGTLNFVKAIPDILRERIEVNFLIGGDGQLRGEIERDLNEHNLNGKVKLTGWILHDNLPQYFNELKLLVIPSYTEGLPNIMIEAMACGTPVLATPVGAIPDVIKDGETGFIMEDNSPECIAKNIIRALNSEHLEKVSQDARVLVEKEFTLNKAIEMYGKILININ